MLMQTGLLLIVGFRNRPFTRRSPKLFGSAQEFDGLSERPACWEKRLRVSLKGGEKRSGQGSLWAFAHSAAGIPSAALRFLSPMLTSGAMAL